jgi:hypothetical protein
MQYQFDYWLLKVAYDWQTLIGGLLALFGAILTVRGINRQIGETKNEVEAAKKRDEFAAKAVLPLALSQLSQYGVDCIELVNPLITGQRREVDHGDETPPVPNDVIEVLQGSARFADDKNANRIAALLGKLQVQQARLRTLLTSKIGRRLHEHEGVSAIIDAADIYVLAIGWLVLIVHSKNIEQPCCLG